MDRLTDQQQHPDLLPHHVRNTREPLGKDKIDDYFIPNARTDLQDIRDLTENFTLLKKKKIQQITLTLTSGYGNKLLF